MGIQSEGCLVVRVTQKDDINSKYGVSKVLAFIKHFAAVKVLLWIAFPCTGGSAYNIGENWNSGRQSTREKISQHWKDYRSFWSSFVDNIAPEIKAAKGRIRQAIELPDSCDYWRWHSGGTCLDGTPHFPLNEYLQEHDLKSVICHGCCFNLRATVGQERGFLLRKTWRIATDVPEIRSFLGNDISGTSPEKFSESKKRCCLHGVNAYRVRPGECFFCRQHSLSCQGREHKKHRVLYRAHGTIYSCRIPVLCHEA